MEILEKDHIRRLKAHAHALKPVVWVGNNGLTPSVLKELDIALEHHELMKIKILDSDREARHQLAEAAAAELQATCISHIGQVTILYRRKRRED